MRKRQPKKLEIKPDPRYNSILLVKFVNNLMLDGKKNTAINIIYKAFDIIKEKRQDENPLEVFQAAIDNVIPMVEVKSRRIGGATFQIPTEVNKARRLSLGMKWMIMFARKRSGRSMADKLAAEILAASNGEGAAVKKKEDTHRMAEANKAFSHFRV